MGDTDSEVAAEIKSRVAVKEATWQTTVHSWFYIKALYCQLERIKFEGLNENVLIQQVEKCFVKLCNKVAEDGSCVFGQPSIAE